MSRRSKDEAIQHLLEQYEEWLNEDNDNIVADWLRFFNAELEVIDEAEDAMTRTTGRSRGSSIGWSDNSGRTQTVSESQHRGASPNELENESP